MHFVKVNEFEYPIVKNDEVLNYTELLSGGDELSDPPICHLYAALSCSSLPECMPELGHHPSCISPQWQFPLLFSRAFLLS